MDVTVVAISILLGLGGKVSLKVTPRARRASFGAKVQKVFSRSPVGELYYFTISMFGSKNKFS